MSLRIVKPTAIAMSSTIIMEIAATTVTMIIMKASVSTTSIVHPPDRYDAVLVHWDHKFQNQADVVQHWH